MVQSVGITAMCYKLCPLMPHVPLVLSHPGPFAAAHHRSPATQLDQTVVMSMANVCKAVWVSHSCLVTRQEQAL